MSSGLSSSPCSLRRPGRGGPEPTTARRSTGFRMSWRRDAGGWIGRRRRVHPRRPGGGGRRGRPGECGRSGGGIFRTGDTGSVGYRGRGSGSRRRRWRPKRGGKPWASTAPIGGRGRRSMRSGRPGGCRWGSRGPRPGSPRRRSWPRSWGRCGWGAGPGLRPSRATGPMTAVPCGRNAAGASGPASRRIPGIAGGPDGADRIASTGTGIGSCEGMWNASWPGGRAASGAGGCVMSVSWRPSGLSWTWLASSSPGEF